MSKIIFNKYYRRAPDYHWGQISHNPFQFNAYVMARYQQVVKLIPQNSRRILDIGCGDGVLLWLVSRKSSAKLYGVDLNQKSLNYAAAKINAKLIKAQAEKLPFKNNYFDTVIATEIIEHLDRPEKLLLEARRVLKRGGRIIITTPVKPKNGLTDKLHVREFSAAELKQLCQRYFPVVKIKTSHPLWLKNVYTWSLGKLGRFHLDLGRWLVNAFVLSTGLNPFFNFFGHPSQQLAVGHK